MDVEEARSLALSLMGKHGLFSQGWSFAFDRSKRRFGQCRYDVKEIGLSKPLTELNDIYQVADTIKHEIAHALSSEHGHGREWKRTAVSVGARPKACYSAANTVEVPGKWVAVCLRCGYESPRRHRRQKGACRRCMNKVRAPRGSAEWADAWLENELAWTEADAWGTA